MSEILQKIEEFAALQFSLEEMKIILEKDCFSKDELRAYDKGRLLASAAVRKALYKSACDNSSPAQTKMLELIDRCDESNKKNTTPVKTRVVKQQIKRRKR